MTDLPTLALQAGATQLGEDGPDGCHLIFSVEQLAAFAHLLEGREPRQAPALPY